MPSADTRAMPSVARGAELSGFDIDADLIANLGSVGMIGAAGLCLNIGVARVYGLEGLGLFSLALAVFLILGQLSAGGFAFSALYHFSRDGADHTDRRSYLLAMVAPVFMSGIAMATTLWLAADLVASFFRNDEIASILPIVGLAALFFGLNKVFFMALNGMGRLKAFALLQGLRMPLMLLALVLLVWSGEPVNSLGWVFIASEAFLLVLAFSLFVVFTGASQLDLRRALLIFQKEGRRGWRGFLIGLLADVNTRVDILVLSVFLSDRLVGIYAFGALMAEGLKMLPSAVQNVINPRLALLVAAKDQSGLSDLYRSLARYGRPAVFALTAIGIMFILVIAPELMNVSDNRQSALVFTLIALGAVAAAPALALDLILSQAGAPGLQARFFGLLVSANFALNLALVPVLGLVGAALATAAVEGLRWGLLNHTLGRHFDLHLWERA